MMQVAFSLMSHTREREFGFNFEGHYDSGC